MKIQYASDLHLEFAENGSYIKHNPLSVTGDVLILAGDIGYIGDENYSKHPFWDWVADNYRHVIACMGNHEFYKYSDIAHLPMVIVWKCALTYIVTITVLCILMMSTSLFLPYGDAFLWKMLILPKVLFRIFVGSFSRGSRLHLLISTTNAKSVLPLFVKQSWRAKRSTRLWLLIMCPHSGCNIQNLQTAKPTEHLPLNWKIT